ncbi:Cfr10I/Bse634I family restriction endonuclease [Oxynema aestuarii]|uniref:Cfr10I/Bse634I family restriction endonuclease n=1 Tax=Oxynema aestuarii AP17 TaxID=2064643 RepID=A0A6H1U5M1_9CYAN|nr:Cfr10I/Bse634I family restriction endonuclease [Oxynema aestuarii]QIZ73333.1 Cfr10I/Bse634I family restriction endonuclease [Oxynema aestuarii AP17]
MNNQNWFSDRNNQIQINTIEIYKSLVDRIERKIQNNEQTANIVDWLVSETQRVFQKNYNRIPTQGALNNSIGRWNEFIALTLFTKSVIDYNQKHPDSYVVVFKLPNTKISRQNLTPSKFLQLFHKQEFEKQGKLAKLSPFKEKIFFPSPDFIIVNLDGQSHLLLGNNYKSELTQLLQQQSREPNENKIFPFLQGKMLASHLKSAISLKTSNRPDRRYQPLFEAAMIKAMSSATHQQWRYYMVASEFTETDQILFEKAIAPHGIAIQKESKFVDNIYLNLNKNNFHGLIDDSMS